MNILQISPQIPFPLIDGGKLGIYGITKSLSERNHKIDFLTFTKDSNLKECSEEMSKFCELHTIDEDINNSVSGVLKNFFSKVPYNISKFSTSGFKQKLVKLLKSKQYDIVHIDHLHMAWTYNIIKQYQDIPVVLRQHNLEMNIMKRYAEEAENLLLKFYCRLQSKKFNTYEPEFCECFDNCLMITEADDKQLLEMNSKVNTSVIPAGVSEHLFEKKRNEVEKYSMVHLGSMEWLPNKAGLEWYLNNVMPGIVEKLPEVKLYLIGKGTDKIEIPAEIKSNVVSLGFVDDLWETVMNIDLAIVPLRSGSGMRIKIIELLAAGQNILSTSIGAEGIGTTDKKNILIADTQEDFINTTLEYFDDKFNKSLLAKNAKLFCEENFRWTEIAIKIEEIYLDLIKKHKTK